jgi:hypothetical protein
MKRLLVPLLGIVLALPSFSAAQPRLPVDLVEKAVRTSPPRWRFVSKARVREIPETFALHVTAVAAHESPDTLVDGKPLASHFAEKLRSFLVTPEPYPDGTTREPEAQGGLGGWTHHVPAHALLLAKRTPAVWDRLSADERARADLLMQALAVAAHHTLDDDNDYYVLLDGYSLFHKSWNPNHVNGYVGVIVAASLYFGADELNAFFRAFDYDTFMTRLDAANFQNIRQCWNWNPEMRGLLMNGGPITTAETHALANNVVTRGRGVRNDFTIDGFTLHDPWHIHRAYALRLYSKATRTRVTVKSDYTTSLMNLRSAAIDSPWEGQMGMLHEFESTDGRGLRSSLTYCFEGAMIDVPTAVMLKLMRVWSPENGGDTLERRMGVGLADLRFKAQEGYRGWSNGRPNESSWEKNLLPMGADYIYALWETYFAPPPAPSR